MKPFSGSILSTLILLLSCELSHADWDWKTHRFEATLTPKGYTVELNFENNGSDKIAVTGMKFSCPCTVFKFTSTTAKPGGTGKVSVQIEAEHNTHFYKDLDVIVFGPRSCQPHELTIRLPIDETPE